MTTQATMTGSGPRAQPDPGKGESASAEGRTRLENRLLTTSLLLSVVVNSLFLLSTMFTVGYGGGGGLRAGKERPDFEIETAEVMLTSIGDAMLDTASPAVMSADIPEPPAFGVADGPGGENAPGEGPGLGAIADEMGGAGGGGIGDGMGVGSGGAGGGTKFFGVEAEGLRIAYIVDVSGSMASDDKLGYLQQQLRGSISEMLDHMSFWVCAFSNGPQMLTKPSVWTVADTKGKSGVYAQIDELLADGGTVPNKSFEMVFTLRPLPDAIYFMTDGQFQPDVVRIISSNNGRGGKKKIPIHCIAFGNDADDTQLRVIAAESGTKTVTHVRSPSGGGGGNRP